MATKNRTDLKSYFVKNAIPTEGNFADLVDSQLNQAQDGVFKPDGEALSVVAAPGDQKRVLRLYANYPAANPDWMISLHPAQDPANAATTGKSGLGITDGTGKTRLFIDAATGRIGVGTNSPSDILHVRNPDTVGLLESSTKQAALQLATSEGTGNYVGFANRSGGNAAISVGTGGDALIVKKDGGVVVSKASGGTGVLTIENRLQFTNDTRQNKIVLFEGYGLGMADANISLFYPLGAYFSLRNDSYGGAEVFTVNGSGDVTAKKSLAVPGALVGGIGIGTGDWGYGKGATYETLQLKSDYNLRVYFGTTQRAMLENSGQFTIYFDKGRWVFQNDGNLVQYDKDGKSLWALRNVAVW